MTLEATSKKWFRNRFAGMFYGMWKYFPPASRFGKKGAPDDLWLVPLEIPAINRTIGVLVAIEHKAPKKDPTKLQGKTLTDLEHAGSLTYVMRGKDEKLYEKILSDIELLQCELESLKYGA